MALKIRGQQGISSSGLTQVPPNGAPFGDGEPAVWSAYNILLAELGINSLTEKLKKTSRATGAQPPWSENDDKNIKNNASRGYLRRGNFNDVNLIQGRLFSIAHIVFGLAPTFAEFYNQYLSAGDPIEKALKNSIEEIDQMFQLKINHLNKIDPDIIYESYIVGNFKNQDMGQRVANYTKLE